MFRSPRPIFAAVLALLSAVAVAADDAATVDAVPAAAPAAQFNVLGREDAPVSIIEFSDLQCPYCARYAAQTFPRLRREYVDTGKVRYAVGDLPLPMHRHAATAAIAARCAGEQGRFWEYREAMFAARGTLGSEPYARIASDLGLDSVLFEACRQDGRQAQNLRSDMALARSNGITATPAFVIGRQVNGEFRGEVVTGAKPFEFFAAKIDALLQADDR